jgi:hypothetical protein
MARIMPTFDNKPLPVYNNATRGEASAMFAGTVIWNTDDNAPNWSDGEYWRDSRGNIT